MIGGRVIEVAEVPGRSDILYVDVADRPYNTIETCAIYVERNEHSILIDIGDSIWWQGRSAMWTPQRNRGIHMHDDARGGVDYDIKIPRVGCSGVEHPSREPAVLVPRKIETTRSKTRRLLETLVAIVLSITAVYAMLACFAVLEFLLNLIPL